MSGRDKRWLSLKGGGTFLLSSAVFLIISPIFFVRDCLSDPLCLGNMMGQLAGGLVVISPGVFILGAVIIHILTYFIKERIFPYALFIGVTLHIISLFLFKTLS